MSTNAKTNQVNDVSDNKLKFESINILDNDPLKDPLPIVTISLIYGNKSRQI